MLSDSSMPFYNDGVCWVIDWDVKFEMLRGEQNGNTWASKMGKFKARPYSGFQ